MRIIVRTGGRAFVNGLGMLLGNLLLGVLSHCAGGELPQAFAVGAIVMAILVVVFSFGFPERRAISSSGH